MSEIRILRVEQKGKKYLVYTSDKDEPITFTEDGIVNNRIIKNAIFDDLTWKKIVKSKDELVIFDKVLHYIDYKQRTTREVVSYLRNKKIDDVTIDSIIQRLNNIHYLDDDRYAREYISEAVKNKVGPILVKYKLEQLGIKDETINKYLVEYSSNTEYENAYNVTIKYQKQILKHPQKKQKELIYQKLIRDGYHNDIINKVLSSIEYGSDSVDNLKKEYDKLLSKNKEPNKIITSLIAKGYRYEDIKKVVKK